MTIWKNCEKNNPKLLVAKNTTCRKFSTLVYKNLRNICLEQQLAKELSRMQFAKKVV